MSIALPTYNPAIDCYPTPPSSPPTSKDVSDAVIYADKAEAKFDRGEISETTFVDVLEYQYKIVSASAKHDAFWRDIEHLIEMRPVHLAEYQERPRVFQAWERIRHKQAQWIIDCVSESLGVFFYCFAGVGAQTAWILGNFIQIPGLGSLFTTGLAYAFGLVFATIVCSSQNGGHFHPGLTITAVLFKKYPVKSAIRHIIAQILGGYIACLLVYLQWKHIFAAVEAALEEAGQLAAVQFTSTGPAGAIALYATPGSSLGLIFVNEFVTDFVIGVVLWTCADPTNYYVPPAMAPWAIGAVYAVAIWGYSPNGLAANTARDVGGRLAALTIWGIDAGGGRYAAIAALTNIPATIAAYVFYEIFFADSSRVVISSHRAVIDGHKAQAEFRENQYDFPSPSPSSDLGEKRDSIVVGHCLP